MKEEEKKSLEISRLIIKHQTLKILMLMPTVWISNKCLTYIWEQIGINQGHMLTSCNLYVFQHRRSLSNQWCRLIDDNIYLELHSQWFVISVRCHMQKSFNYFPTHCCCPEIMLLILPHKVPKIAHPDLPRVVWESSWRPDRCSRCSSCQFRSHSCRHSAWPADNEGRRRRWWPLAPPAGLQNSFEEYSCTAWHHQTDGSDQLDSQKEEKRK